MIFRKTFFLWLIIFYGCTKNTPASFNSGATWLDTDDKQINAHGGGFLFFNDTYYWFGEHKGSGKLGSKAQVGVRVYASKDLHQWKNEGVALSVTNDTLSKLQKGCVVERPKVIYNEKTQKFVMWFHHELKDQGYKAALTGVAIADKVTGPYKYLDSDRIHAGVLPQNYSKEQFLNTKKIISRKEENWKDKVIQGGYFVRDFEGGQMSRDMTLFVDEDQTAYHIASSEENNTLLISKLSDEYTAFTNQYVRVLPGGRNEAPAIFKTKGKYFMFSSGLSGWKPNAGKLSMADSMMGEWTPLENPCVGTNQEKESTFWSQSTYIIPVQGKKEAFIFAADRWNPENLMDSHYVWLPIKFNNNIPFIAWSDSWDLATFN
jgi:hypothetical protein